MLPRNPLHSRKLTLDPEQNHGLDNDFFSTMGMIGVQPG